MNLNSITNNPTDKKYKKIQIPLGNQNEPKLNNDSVKNKCINTNLPVILKCPPLLNENNNSDNKNLYYTVTQNIATTNNDLNSFSNETVENVFKQKNYHLNKLKDYLRKKPIKGKILNGSIFNNDGSKKINYIQLSANFNTNKNKNKSKINILKYKILDNSDMIKVDYPYTSRALNKNTYYQINNNDINFPVLPPVENLLKSHLKMYTPKIAPCQKNKSVVKQIILKTIINKNKETFSKSLDIKNHNGGIWTIDNKKKKNDENKNDTILFKNKKIYDKLMKCTAEKKNNFIKNKTFDEIKRSNLKKNRRQMEKAFDEYSEKKKFISNYLEKTKKEFDQYDACINKDHENCLYDD